MISKIMFKWFLVVLVLLIVAYKKSTNTGSIIPALEIFKVNEVIINNRPADANQFNQPFNPVILISFSAPVNSSTITAGINLKSSAGENVQLVISHQNSDSVLILQPSELLVPLTSYTLSISKELTSQSILYYQLKS